MVEKKEFDSLLIDLIKLVPSIRYSMVLDREGFPISYIGQTLDDRQNIKTLGAVFRSLFSSIYEYGGVYNTSAPILSVVFLNDRIVLQINMGYGIASFIVNKFKWPVSGANFQQCFNQLFKLLPQLQTNKKSLLKDLYIEGYQQNGIYNKIDENTIPVVIDCIDQLGKGSFGKIDWPISDSDPASLCNSIGTFIGQLTLNSLIISSDETILFQNGTDSEKIGKILNSTYESNALDLNAVEFGLPLLSVYCYEKGETILIAPIGQLNQSTIQLCCEFPNWNVGMNQLISNVYTAAAVSHEIMGSESSTQFIELMNFLMSDVSDLKQQIDAYLGVNDNDHARELMERSAYLLQNMDQPSLVADYLKWVAYTYFQQGNYPKTLENYERSLKYYHLAQNVESEATNHMDLASVYELMKQQSAALEEYQKAIVLFRQLGNEEQTNDLEKKINDTKSMYKMQLKDYIDNMTGESLIFDTLGEKFNIKLNILADLLQELISEKAIPGQIDTFKGRYTKSIMRTQGSVQSMANTRNKSGQAADDNGSGITAKPVDYSNAYDDSNKLKAENVQLNTELGQIERNFQTKGINFMELIKYQAKLEKKNYNELKIRILTELPTFNETDGTPITCATCLNPLNPSEPISVCSNGHGYHAKCLSKWIKTQDRCPLCNEKLLPFILRDYREGSGSANIGSANSEEIESLKQQITLLKQSIGTDANLVDTISAEREDKQRLMNELKKKDRLVAELKSQLSATKKK